MTPLFALSGFANSTAQCGAICVLSRVNSGRQRKDPGPGHYAKAGKKARKNISNFPKAGSALINIKRTAVARC